MPFSLRTSHLATTFLIGLAFSAVSRAGDPPMLTAIQPAGANVGGGNSVLISGTNLSTVTGVTFDGVPATIFRQDANSLYVTAPPHAAGTVAIVASESGRRPAGAPQLNFTYFDDFDAGRDFSAVQNPVGAWTYGVSPTLGQPIAVDATTGITGCIDTWHGADSHPVIGRNRTSGDCNLFSWSWPAGMIGIHPDNTPEHGVIRFTAPVTERYLVDGRFLCIDYVVSCTVHVAILHNLTTTVFTRNISASFVSQYFNFEIDLAAGDTLDFSQGNGGNHYNYDQMVLDARIYPPLFGDSFE